MRTVTVCEAEETELIKGKSGIQQVITDYRRVKKTAGYRIMQYCFMFLNMDAGAVLKTEPATVRSQLLHGFIIFQILKKDTFYHIPS
jgi:hypothetical protein